MKNAPLRILHVVYSLDPGGMENGIVNITSALDPEQFHVDVCCLERRGAFADRLPPTTGVSVIDRAPGFSWATGQALRRELLRLRPHLIHSHNLGPLIYSVIATLGGLSVPILQGEHAELTTEDLTFRRLWLRRCLYRCCHSVHSVSHGLHDQLCRLRFPRSKLRVIVNGVDTARFAVPDDKTCMEARRNLGIPSHALVLGIVGRFGPFKRHQLLIEAFEHFVHENPDLYLLIVGGGGPEEPAVRARHGQSQFSNRILLTGFQPDPRPCYAAMDLLVVPSANEGLSNAVLEAMACGRPVLAHRACGNAEVITAGVDGFLEDLSTPEYLQMALAQVLKAPEHLPVMGVHARSKVASQFSLEKMVQEYKDIYRTVASVR